MTDTGVSKSATKVVHSTWARPSSWAALNVSMSGLTRISGPLEHRVEGAPVDGDGEMGFQIAAILIDEITGDAVA